LHMSGIGNRKMAIAAVVVLAALAGGCASDVTVHETIRKPSEINMAGYEQVRLDGIKGPGGDVINARLKQALFGQQFKVLDRSSIGAAMGEKSLGDLGMSQDSSGGGQMMRADVLIRGTVLRHDCNQNSEPGQWTVNGVRQTLYTTHAQAIVEVTMEVIDLRTSQVIATKSIPAQERQKSNAMPSPVRLAEAPLYDACYNDVVNRFMRMIAVHDDVIPVHLVKVKGVIENDNGIALFQQKNYAEAARQFAAAVQVAKSNPKLKPKDIAGINHNCGLACEFMGQYPTAQAWYRQAMSLNSDPKYASSVGRCQQRVADEAELKKQGK
jgi:hypothetical protein